MGVGTEWWELRPPRTNRDYIDAYVRIALGRMRIPALSPRAKRVSSEAGAALKWCQALRCPPSPAFPWKRVGAKGSSVLERLYASRGGGSIAAALRKAGYPRARAPVPLTRGGRAPVGNPRAGRARSGVRTGVASGLVITNKQVRRGVS
jgi:hypothetical protein